MVSDEMRETANFQAPAKAVSLLLFAILRISSHAARLSNCGAAPDN